MLIVEFDGPPSWFLDVRETGERIVSVGGDGGVNAGVKGQKKLGDCKSFTLMFTALAAWSAGA